MVVGSLVAAEPSVVVVGSEVTVVEVGSDEPALPETVVVVLEPGSNEDDTGTVVVVSEGEVLGDVSVGASVVVVGEVVDVVVVVGVTRSEILAAPFKTR